MRTIKNTDDLILWDEKNLTVQKQNCESNPISAPSVIINETKTELKRTECNDTGNEKKWTKQCPKCGCEQKYTQRFTLLKAIKKNTWCKQCKIENTKNLIQKEYTKLCPKCGIEQKYKNRKTYRSALIENTACRKCNRIGINKGRVMGEEQKKKISSHHKKHGVGKWMLGRHLKNETKLLISLAHKGKKITQQHKNNISKGKKGKKMSLEYRIKISEYFKKHPKIVSEETRHKLSIKAKINVIHQIEKMGGFVFPFFNPDSCKYFDELNKQNGWNLQHARNGGEKRILCYFPDAYDEERNIIVEYDEKHHFDVYGNLKKEDVIRMRDIIKHLNCKFFRYREETKEFKEFTLKDCNIANPNDLQL